MLTIHNGRETCPSRRLIVLVLMVFPCVGIAAGESSQEEAKSFIPWKSIEEKNHAKVGDVVNHPTVYHRSASEVFACSPELYLLYLNEPVLTLELWRALGSSDATLDQIGPGQYRGSDGHASSGRWEFVHRSPELSVIYAEGQYRGPLLGTMLETRSVLVLRAVFFQERDGKTYVKHQLDGFVRAESGGLKPLAITLRPIFAKSVDATMQETLWFISLMCRYTNYDPHAVAHALDQTDKVQEPVKARMQKLLAPLLASTPERKEVASREEEKR